MHAEVAAPPRRPLLALTQGDPAGVGPEVLLRLVADRPRRAPWRPLLVAERVALEAVRACVDDDLWERLAFVDGAADGLGPDDGSVPVLDPVAERRQVAPGRPTAADAAGAVAALDAGIELCRAGLADALVTAPVSKESIARHVLPGFRGHTEYLAAACGLQRYGRDYLMAFLDAELQVALLSTHLPLVEAVSRVTSEGVLAALECLGRHAGGRIALAGLNPHAGEGGLLGAEEEAVLAPAVAAARSRGLDVHGPESPDSLFARARRGEFDWVLALYHDQGLIAVKTVGFGTATNWTLGLPFLRTSVDHGTAFEIAGKGVADAKPMARVVETTLKLLSGELPRRGERS